MNHTVVMTTAAERQLAELWLKDTQRSAVSRAADEIERRLRRDPEQQGESRDRGRRILIESPLSVLYRVEPADRKVVIVAVWRSDSE